MRKIDFILLLLLISIKGYSQFMAIDPYGETLYQKGSSMIKLGDYKAADSLLTMSLCSFSNENVYFNRAIARLYLADTIGFCEDIQITANKYLDNEAGKLFNTLCCNRADTIYYDKKRNIISSEEKYRYYEIIKDQKYDSLIVGTFHDKKAKIPYISLDVGCSNTVMNAYKRTSNIIASYTYIEGIKYYTKSTSNNFIKSIQQYKRIEDETKALMRRKYSKIKSENPDKELRLYFDIYVNDEGEIFKIEYSGLYPEIAMDENIENLEKDLFDIYKNLTKIRPAKFFDKKVYFITSNYIEL